VAPGHVACIHAVQIIFRLSVSENDSVELKATDTNPNIKDRRNPSHITKRVFSSLRFLVPNARDNSYSTALCEDRVTSIPVRPTEHRRVVH
jgi:hypothetical protein